MLISFKIMIEKFIHTFNLPTKITNLKFHKMGLEIHLQNKKLITVIWYRLLIYKIKKTNSNRLQS